MIKEQMLLEDLKAVLSEAKSMGCTEVRRFEHIQLEKLEMIVNALEKQIFKFVECKGWNGHSGTRYKCPTCKKIIRCGYEYCSNCGQAVKFPKTKLVDGRIVLDWSETDENKEDH